MSSYEVDPYGLDSAEDLGTPYLTRALFGTVYQGAAIYGTGVDGDIHVNANSFTWVSPLGDTAISGGVLQRSLAPSSLIIDQGVTLYGLDTGIAFPTPWSIICSGTFQNLGTLIYDAAAAAGVTGGLGTSTGTVLSFGASRSGATSQNFNAGSIGSAGDLGGTSGAAGNGTSGSGQSAVAAFTGPIYTSLAFFLSALPRWGGSSGSSGSGDTTHKGGGGGAGGALALIAAGSFDNTAGIIRARGGAGGTPPTGNCGGGGGGGGGAIAIVTPSRPLDDPFTGSQVSAEGVVGVLDTQGGAAGAGVGSGTAGSAGSTGNVFLFYST